MSNVNSTGTNKEAGVLVYLVEELTDARLRCEQLKKFVSQAVRLIASSPQRDHFYEVAGDTIYGIPDALFKLDKALAATALAASRLDYEELKSQLKPEKVEELEDVLRSTRIRQIDRVSPFIQPRLENGQPKQAGALEVRDINQITTTLENILLEAMHLRKSLPPQLRDKLEGIEDLADKALKTIKHSSTTAPSSQEKRASMFRAASSNHISTALHRIADEVQAARISPQEASRRVRRVLMALSQTSQQALEAMGPVQATSREEVMKGFKSANPDLTEAQLEEIADQWERNKNVVKEKHADDDAKRSRFEEGKPADPTQNMSPADAAEWKKQNEENKDNFKSARSDNLDPSLNTIEESLKSAKSGWEKYQSNPQKYKPQLGNVSQDLMAIASRTRVALRIVGDLDKS